ncbi:hypothetical protein G6F70_002930 [Rhizopus microsporus]|uniref:PROP1-like PPR domain-containing protein n=2 Tax=Rhizopus TaxID=4842 RepID=A0A367JH15_RHIAZ|nr:hypothetical protein G6F71_002817 [Rhizopus microsporus]RCH89186.1 hypothetical protein CU097_007769 [Rhizopus azygosporus]KAG1201682.1 hypothetical protein G6F70_002930 [Rhizopus microsporus]KAG1212065.1 hypothetical protein G6F69_004029 [Rhizopus microsporus]KAG1234040.1 hypothetical protein G6F67_003839 [Rhizopus microsporus]
MSLMLKSAWTFTFKQAAIRCQLQSTQKTLQLPLIPIRCLHLSQSIFQNLTDLQPNQQPKRQPSKQPKKKDQKQQKYKQKKQEQQDQKHQNQDQMKQEQQVQNSKQESQDTPVDQEIELLSRYAKERDFISARRFYERLRSRGVQIPANVHAEYFFCLPASYNYDKLWTLYEDIKREGMERNRYFYNTLIAKFGRLKRPKDAIAIFEDMKKSGIMPNKNTYASVISACVRSKAQNSAMRFFDEMKEAGKISPPAINTMMKFYLRYKSDKQKALECYQLLEKAGMLPNVHTYRLLLEIHAYYRPYDMQKAKDILREMEQRNVTPDARHYVVLINSYGNRQRDLSSAVKIYDSMIAGGIEPDDNMYQVMALIYSKHGDTEKANEFRYKIG